jgi:hypothetical protein
MAVSREVFKKLPSDIVSGHTHSPGSSKQQNPEKTTLTGASFFVKQRLFPVAIASGDMPDKIVGAGLVPARVTHPKPGSDKPSPYQRGFR